MARFKDLAEVLPQTNLILPKKIKVRKYEEYKTPIYHRGSVTEVSSPLNLDALPELTLFKMVNPFSDLLSPTAMKEIYEQVVRRSTFEAFIREVETYVGYDLVIPNNHPDFPAGKITKRFVRHFDLRTEQGEAIGNIIAKFKPPDYLYFDLVDTTSDWDLIPFSHPGSCYRIGGQYSYSPMYLDLLGTRTMRFYDFDDQDFSFGVGRVFIIPDKPYKGVYTLFNSYSIGLTNIGSLLGELLNYGVSAVTLTDSGKGTGKVSRRRGSVQRRIYVNSLKGVVLFPDEENWKTYLEWQQVLVNGFKKADMRLDYSLPIVDLELPSFEEAGYERSTRNRNRILYERPEDLILWKGNYYTERAFKRNFVWSNIHNNFYTYERSKVAYVPEWDDYVLISKLEKYGLVYLAETPLGENNAAPIDLATLLITHVSKSRKFLEEIVSGMLTTSISQHVGAYGDVYYTRQVYIDESNTVANFAKSALGHLVDIQLVYAQENGSAITAVEAHHFNLTHFGDVYKTVAMYDKA